MIYKILTAEQWAAREGVLPWAPVDRSDGFVHFSSADQLRETAIRHFSGQENLVLVRVDEAQLDPDALRWEKSRGGALFPHVYGQVNLSAVVRVWVMQGAFEMPGLD